MLKSLLICIILLFSHYSISEPLRLQPDEVLISKGSYYVGQVFGDHNYNQHTTTSLHTFLIMKTEITYAFYQSVLAWANKHGYQLNEGCNGALFEDCQSTDMDAGLHPVTNVSWWDAVLFANALSEYSGLIPFYRSSDDRPLRDIPGNGAVKRVSSGEGYRLPTLEEWHVAARGGKPALIDGTYGTPYSGSTQPESVANFPAGNSGKFATVKVASKSANALGLFDMSGNVSEWLDESWRLESGITLYFYCGGSFMNHTKTLASCDMHTPGFITPDIGFRLVRSRGD